MFERNGFSRKTYNVAVAGATGLVGREMISILAERKFPVAELLPLASLDSRGAVLDFGGDALLTQVLDEANFKNIDIALFSAGSDAAKRYAPKATAAGCVVIDNSSAFRGDPDVPLVVPEVNAEAIKEHNGVIANPNCTTIQLVVILKPLLDAFGLERVVVSSCQSVSGYGKKAMTELQSQVTEIFSCREVETNVFPCQIAFNCIPHIGQFGEDGYSDEERKVISETRKILDLPDLRITCTAIRVPVFIGHSESVNIEFQRETSVYAVREVLQSAPGVQIIDDTASDDYPHVLLVQHFPDHVMAGRIRKDASTKSGVDLWTVADNLRKGAALNAVQIAERLIENELNE